MDNSAIADRLRQHARELDSERGNLFRVRAYRRAADAILEMEEPLTDVLERDGLRGLRLLPRIGRHLARVIDSLICTGEIPPRRRVPAA